MIAAPTTFTVRVNDAEYSVAADATLHDLLRDLNLAEKKGIAVALNNEVVSRKTWPTRLLKERDNLLVIQATQGG